MFLGKRAPDDAKQALEELAELNVGREKGHAQKIVVSGAYKVVADAALLESAQEELQKAVEKVEARVLAEEQAKLDKAMQTVSSPPWGPHQEYRVRDGYVSITTRGEPKVVGVRRATPTSELRVQHDTLMDHAVRIGLL